MSHVALSGTETLLSRVEVSSDAAEECPCVEMARKVASQIHTTFDRDGSMSRRTLKKIAILGALSLGGMTQPAMAQFGLFGGGGFGGGCCAPPPIPQTICGPQCAPVCEQPVAVCPVVPQYVMQPFTETREVAQVVHRPVCETKMVQVPQTEYRPVVENQVATVPDVAYQDVPQTAYRPVTEQQVRNVQTVAYQNVTEMQCRQRDVGQFVTQYRCRPTVAPCAYDARPGLLGALNRGFYSARMAVTPAVVAERTYVPNVITEQVPVTRQVAVPVTRQVAYNVTRMVPYQTTARVAVPTTRQVAYQVTKMVPYTTMRQVAVQETRMVAETIRQPVTTTTYRMVPAGTATVLGGDPYLRNAFVPADPRFAQGPDPRLAPIPDPRVGSPPVPPSPLREANRANIDGGLDNSGSMPPSTPPAPIPARKRGRNPLLNDDPNPGVPGNTQTDPVSNPGEGEEMVELAETSAPTIRYATGSFEGVTPEVQTVSSTPSIVRIVRQATVETTDETSDVAVAANDLKLRK
jgi:hypothetical protein